MQQKISTTQFHKKQNHMLTKDNPQPTPLMKINKRLPTARPVALHFQELARLRGQVARPPRQDLLAESLAMQPRTKTITVYTCPTILLIAHQNSKKNLETNLERLKQTMGAQETLLVKGKIDPATCGPR